MKLSQRATITLLVTVFSLCLLFMGALRFSSANETFLSPISGLATLGYILASILFTILLVRNGLPLNKFGFGTKLNFRHILFACAGVALLQLFSYAINPILENIVGSSRNLERFSDVQGSTSALFSLLIRNWTLAAFGEEFTYRIVLLNGLYYLLGDSKRNQILAIAIQSVMFGLIHAYQGPAGIVGSMVSGLLFGTLVVVGGWSIWPAAIAHGLNNTIGIIGLYFGR